MFLSLFETDRIWLVSCSKLTSKSENKEAARNVEIDKIAKAVSLAHWRSEALDSGYAKPDGKWIGVRRLRLIANAFSGHVDLDYVQEYPICDSEGEPSPSTRRNE